MMITKKTKAQMFEHEMPGLDFTYDAEFYPDDVCLPDPQVDPILLGARVPIQKMGVSGVDLPITFMRRTGVPQELQVKASLYASHDDVNSKGLNLSRFPLIMYEVINSEMIHSKGAPSRQHFSIDVIKDILADFSKKQDSQHTYCRFKFSYPWTQKALRTRKELAADAPADQVFKTVEGKLLSYDKAEGYIMYPCELEGQLHNGKYRFFLTVSYTYSSTCPCSFELAYDARTNRNKAANAHSQRSTAKITIEFDHNNPVWIEDVVELAREYIPTEVQVVVKRRDEQAFAELNGANLMFAEDAARLMYEGLDTWFTSGKISDFSVVIDHEESLHPWNATAVIFKGIPGGLK